MAEIVSLNQYRKARRRSKAATEASRNRVRYGRSRADRDRDAADRDLQSKAHDGNRLEQGDRPQDAD